jgi:PAS domain S-box-containing protein
VVIIGDEISIQPSKSVGTVHAGLGEPDARIDGLAGEGLTGGLDLFLNNPTPGVLYNGNSLQILDANQEAAALYGYTREQFCGMNMLDLFASLSEMEGLQLRAELLEPSRRLGPFLHSGASQQLTVHLLTFSVRVGGAEVRLAFVKCVPGGQGAEEALRGSEERFRELFENANDVIFLQDLQGKILTINRAAESLTGYSRQEVLGQSIDNLIDPDARPLHHDSIRAHLGGSATQHYELAFLSKKHNRRFLEVSSRILYRAGQPYAVQGIGRDITERKLAQQRLQESAEELQRTNRELSTALRLAREATQTKERFLANTSHELRTPLNGIMGMVNLLKSTDLTSDQRDYADTVGQCANDLLMIINDLLDLSQMDAGRIVLDEESIELQECLEAVLKMLRVRASAKGLLLSSEVEDGLPTHVYADGLRLRQVLTNLIANAVKFTATGGVHVRVSCAPCGTRFRCEVIDSGIGVDETVHDRIFEAFFQADGTTRRRFGGNGLGLAICKQLVGIMGGQIGVHCNHDGSPGTTFWFELPLRTSETSTATCRSVCTVPQAV